MPARNPQEAAQRLLCLMSQGARGYFEGELKKGAAADPADARERIDALLDWLRSEGLWPHLSAREAVTMAQPTGEWTDRDQINAGWRVESSGVIAWSLKLIDNIPPYDKEFRPLHIMDVIPQTGESTNGFIRSAAFRPEDSIAEARDIAEHWLWRSRKTRLVADRDKYPDPVDVVEIIKYTVEAARTGEANGWFKPIDDDFPAFGKAYADLSSYEHSLATSIGTERLWALNWLCEEERDWDKVSLDT